MFNWKRTFFGLCLTAMAAMLLLSTGCKPDFPKCETDEHCADSEKGQATDRLYCVNGLCQECRQDGDCAGEGMECNAGVCEQIEGYCTATTDCPGNQKCRDNRCGPECTSDDECEGDLICQGGSCVEKPECSTDADCAAGESCQGGKCVQAAATTCTLETVYFAYDSSALDSGARETVAANAECIKQRDMSVRLAGHADERGTSEYNIALGERRAQSVYNYLKSLGVDTGAMSTISYGEEQLVRQCGEQGASSCHRQNRRVEFSRR